jgi:hypothetical protein
VSPSTPETSTLNPQLAEITATVDVGGGYFEIEDFLVRLENLINGSDPGRVPPRSVLVQAVNVTSGSEDATGDSAASTAASPGELKGDIVLTVFQLAQPGGTSSTPAAPAATASPGPKVR